MMILGHTWCSLPDVHHAFQHMRHAQGYACDASQLGLRHPPHPSAQGYACDVSQPGEVRALANFASSELGHVDIW